jgi:phosphoglycolate phosphatase-like HAD superfamily hydrolase
MEQKRVFVLDFDGSLVKSIMPLVLPIAKDCIRRYFGEDISIEDLKKIVREHPGFPIGRILSEAFPGVQAILRNSCATEIREKMNQIELETLPGVKETIPELANKGKVLISSRSPKKRVVNWVKQEGLLKYIRIRRGIFGEQQGSKRRHVELVRERFRKSQIFYVSDDPGDMGLGIGIGVAPKGKEGLFYDRGAVRVVNDFSHILQIDLAAI